ncbi:exodeoxyribonuclease V subunit beta [uncultured Thiodictyon sp.]|uniref:exodeoxyribonuclease V subunit beta n=1 Tax=uncultured Thiodictyon sp. TaxID=1846217 RepID=UPI0025CBC24B|nr:exodeoxyribonuclease V subunit beta [uncultured Thiodictyon sp.]
MPVIDRNSSTADAPQTLDALRFPLHGSRLIEASAGTGKTFTIATLYVRLVLGHGEPEPPPQPREDDLAAGAATDAFPRGAWERVEVRAFTPPEILVVTFTDAATQELRERIRARLSEAAGAFSEDPAGVAAQPVGHDLLHDLRAEYPPERWPACARKLQLAAEWMDEAAVSTIHAWCNRMLREHAFDSDSLFTQTLETDQSELLAEVVRDYWRTFMVPLDAEAVAEVRQWWSDPAALQADLRGLVDHAERLADAPEPASALRTLRVEREQRLAEIKAPWASWVDELQRLLDGAVAAKQVNGRKLQARYYNPWLAALRDWCGAPAAVALDLKTGWTRLTPDGLAEAWSKGEPPDHPALTAMVTLGDDLANLPNARPGLLRHAARWVAGRFAVEQARRAQMGFNDLLTRLADALDGPNGARLAEIVRRQFPVALIDEFQDTDPVQYRIFDAVYRVADNDPATALVLIGDPKQAIYAFRGADIFTYLQARLACAGRLYTLRRNFRSTHAMVGAVNRCFLAAEERATGRGAFLFRDAAQNPVPFIAAQSQGRADVWSAEGLALPALTAWWLPAPGDDKPLTKGAYRDQIAAACASEIVRLLNLGQAGRAGFGPAEAPRKLRPADLAILVNKRHEADLIRRALAQRGVRSVYLSDQDSVFRSPQAGELRHWLAACAEPDDPRRLHTALATATLGLDWAELERMNQDELAWEARVFQFHGYRDLWRRRGVLPMLRRLLNDFQVPARLLNQGQDPETMGSAPALEGERILTNLLHLAELLQQSSTLLEGEHALIRHLAEQCEDGASGANGDARQLRLESDADLVQVVTVHKSKGLEYPLVFLPFAADHRPTKATDLPLKWHDDTGELRLTLTAEEAALEQADRERLGEDLRKLYVALTRARYATWVGLGPLAGLENGAFGYLLGGGEPLGPDGLTHALEALRGDCPDLAICPAPEPTDAQFSPVDASEALGTARVSGQVVSEPWWIASYSALRTVAGEAAHRIEPELTDPSAETPAEDRFREQQIAPPALPEATAALEPPPDQTAAQRRPAPGTPHDFPRGSEAGTFLHDLLEWAATRGFAAVAADRGLLRDTVARRCQMRGWDHWVEPLTDWLHQLITQPLRLPALGDAPPTELSLAGLGSAVPEMEFWLAAHRVDARAVDRLVSAHTLGGAPRPALQPNTLNGMLKGFMDLVCEHQGRYYVADYKSNWLGPDAAAYTPQAMRAAILHARYELQYVLYLFALHRLLKARLPDYDYDRHIGGALYLFLRGAEAPSQGLHVERPPRALIEQLDDCFTGSTAESLA